MIFDALSCLLLFIGLALPADATYDDYFQINKGFLFGDSITEYAAQIPRGSNYSFQSRFNDRYIRRLDIINRGFGGYNTSAAVRLLPRVIPPPEHGRILFMTIAFGTNDAILPGYSRHVPLEDYCQNLNDIINYPGVTQHNATIVVVTPPPIDERRATAGNRGNKTRTVDIVKEYADKARAVAADNPGVLVLDLWTVMMKLVGWTPDQETPLPGSDSIPSNDLLNSYLIDGVHLTGAGYRIYADELIRVLNGTQAAQQNITAIR